MAWRVLRAGHPPPDLGDDRILALQPRTDTPISKHTKPAYIWPEPQILEAVGSKIRLVNTSNEPKSIGRLQHLSQILPTRGVPSLTPSLTPTVRPKCSPPLSSAVSIDPDNLLPDQSHLKFQQLLQEYDRFFDPKITGYNGAAGPIQATVNIGPVQPPQRKGRIPQYSRNQLVELQAMFDELEQAKVFRRPEDLGITVEYLNPLFLVKKPSGGHRLVTAFADVARYSKPQPSLMSDVNTTLRTITPWRYLIKTDLTQANYAKLDFELTMRVLFVMMNLRICITFSMNALTQKRSGLISNLTGLIFRVSQSMFPQKKFYLEFYQNNALYLIY